VYVPICLRYQCLSADLGGKLRSLGDFESRHYEVPSNHHYLDAIYLHRGLLSRKSLYPNGRDKQPSKVESRDVQLAKTIIRMTLKRP
jgi:hypothetical protein